MFVVVVEWESAQEVDQELGLQALKALKLHCLQRLVG
jgi:hypothetical protein